MAEAFPIEDNLNDEVPVEFVAPLPLRYLLISSKWDAIVQSIAVNPLLKGLYVDKTLDHLFRDASVENRLLLFDSEDKFTCGKFELVEITVDGKEKAPTMLQPIPGIMLRTNKMNENERAGIIHNLHIDRVCDMTTNHITQIETHGHLAMWPMDEDVNADRSFRKIKTCIPEEQENRLVLRLKEEDVQSTCRFVDVAEFPLLLERLMNARTIEIVIPRTEAVYNPEAIYVSGMPAYFNNEEMLRATFQNYGRIARCKPSKNAGEKAFVLFEDVPNHPAVTAVNNILQMAAIGAGIVVQNVRLNIERVIEKGGSAG